MVPNYSREHIPNNVGGSMENDFYELIKTQNEHFLEIRKNVGEEEYFQ